MDPIREEDAAARADGGRVVWDPARALWFGGAALAAAAGAPLAFDAAAALACAGVTGLTLCAGLSVGVHRGLIHRSYRAPRWLEVLLVYLGVLVGLGGPLGLARAHEARDVQQNRPRCHDYFAHRRGLLVDWWWILCCGFEFAAPRPSRLDPRLFEDRAWRFLERTWRWQQLPWALAAWLLGGWPWLVWLTFVRVAAGTTGYWLVNFVAHRPGYRAYENRGAGVQGWNSLALGALSMGEGWHNNHHAFPRSARFGLRWWELDLGWALIAALRALGLARDVRLADQGTRAAAAVALAAPLAGGERTGTASRAASSRDR